MDYGIAMVWETELKLDESSKTYETVEADEPSDRYMWEMDIMVLQNLYGIKLWHQQH